jgi:hypothetical protein
MITAKDLLKLMEEFNPDDYDVKMNKVLRLYGWKRKGDLPTDHYTHHELPGHSIEVMGSHMVHHKPDGSKETPYMRELGYLYKLHKKD